MRGKTILFGLDGATYTVLDPLIEAGCMPNLRRFLARGVRATLSSTVNPLTPPAWTSMITGCNPGRHGIFDFIQPVESADGLYFKLTDSRDIRCETLWSMLSRQGRTVASLNFPVTFPPQPLNGYLIPGFVTGRHLRRAVHPPQLFEELKKLPGFDVKEVAWDLDMEKKAIQDVPLEEYEPWIEFHLRRQQQWAAIIQHMMAHHEWDLMALVDDGPDKLQHLAWPYLDPACFPADPSPRDLRIRELCRSYFRRLDQLLGEVVALGGPDARIFIASDHGFCGTRRIFYVNEWLHEHGHLAWRDGAAINDSEDIAAARMKTQYHMLDWRKTRAYTPTPSCSGIYIREAKRRGDPGVPASKYQAFRRQLVDDLLAYRDPETNCPVIDKVIAREEAFSGDCTPGAPDLTLRLRDQGFPSVVNSGVVMKTRKRVTGSHHPDGVFMAAGEGIRRAAGLGPFAITDVCPMLAYSVGAGIPEGLDGVLPLALFEPSFLKSHPPGVAGSAAMRASAGDGVPVPSDEENSDLLERLRAMGYVE